MNLYSLKLIILMVNHLRVSIIQKYKVKVDSLVLWNLSNKPHYLLIPHKNFQYIPVECSKKAKNNLRYQNRNLLILIRWWKNFKKANQQRNFFKNNVLKLSNKLLFKTGVKDKIKNNKNTWKYILVNTYKNWINKNKSKKMLSKSI